MNTRDYFTPLVRFLAQAVSEKFMHERHLRMWQVVASPEQVPEALEAAESWSVEARDFVAVR